MREKSVSNRSSQVSPWLFFAVVFLWTWGVWGIAALMGVSMDSPAGMVIPLIGVAGPTLAGVAFTTFVESRDVRRDYWRRVAGFGRIPFRWYLVILFFSLALTLVAVGLDMALGGSLPAWNEAVTGFVSSPLSIIPSILFVSLIPFLEELGWRYALDRLQATRTALVSSLILGVIWSLWHLPLFFVPGTYQSGLGFGTLAFWLYVTSIVPLTFVVTWIYNNTRASIVAVILFHAAINFTGELLTLSQRADVFFSALWVVAAVVITLVWGPATMTGRSAPRPEVRRSLRPAGD